MDPGRQLCGFKIRFVLMDILRADKVGIPKCLLLALLKLPGRMPVTLQLTAPSVGKITPREIDLPNMRRILPDALQQLGAQIL